MAGHESWRSDRVLLNQPWAGWLSCRLSTGLGSPGAALDVLLKNTYVFTVTVGAQIQYLCVLLTTKSFLHFLLLLSSCVCVLMIFRHDFWKCTPVLYTASDQYVCAGGSLCARPWIATSPDIFVLLKAWGRYGQVPHTCRYTYISTRALHFNRQWEIVWGWQAGFRKKNVLYCSLLTGNFTNYLPKDQQILWFGWKKQICVRA